MKTQFRAVAAWSFILKGPMLPPVRQDRCSLIRSDQTAEEESHTRVGLSRAAAAEGSESSADRFIWSEMTKTKKEKVSAEEPEAAVADGNEKSYHELIANVNPIAQPLASRKLSKKLYKCVKKGEKEPDPGS